jgi:hypothetical protein
MSTGKQDKEHSWQLVIDVTRVGEGAADKDGKQRGSSQYIE